MRKYILNKDKVCVPASTLEWAQWLETHNDERIVEQTEIGDILVSTVFIGLDHNFSENGPREVFETMVFRGNHDGYQERYATWAQAVEGHARALAALKEKTQ